MIITVWATRKSVSIPCLQSSNRISTSDVKIFFENPTPFNSVECNIFLFLGLVFSVSNFPQQGLIPMLWLLQHFGVSNSMQVSHPQLPEMASLGLHSGIPLTHAWSQQFSLVIKANSIASFFELNSKVKNHIAEAAKFCCRQREVFHATGSSLSIQNLKAHAHSGTHLPTRPWLLQQSCTSK